MLLTRIEDKNPIDKIPLDYSVLGLLQMPINSTGSVTVYNMPSMAQTGPTGPTGPLPWGDEPNYQMILFQLTNELAVLRKDIVSLKEELLNRPLVSSILLNDLADEKIDIRIPISIIIEETDEECSARWPEVNAFGIGSTVSEAIYNLKRQISDLYSYISSKDKKTLGVIALDNLKTMETHIGVKK